MGISGAATVGFVLFAGAAHGSAFTAGPGGAEHRARPFGGHDPAPPQ
jgi:hypothetical protein